MNTTNLFVELVVIGVGVIVWLALFVFSFVGLSLTELNSTLLISSALPVLAFIYVLGIIWDRFIDYVFDRFWGDSLQNEHFKDRNEYYNARRNILINSEPLSDLLEYGRSRMRICRGWSANAIMIGINLNLYLWLQHSDYSHVTNISIIGSLLSLVLAVASYFAWRNLTRVEYRKIKDQSKYISDCAQGDT